MFKSLIHRERSPPCPARPVLMTPCFLIISKTGFQSVCTTQQNSQSSWTMGNHSVLKAQNLTKSLKSKKPWESTGGFEQIWRSHNYFWNVPDASTWISPVNDSPRISPKRIRHVCLNGLIRRRKLSWHIKRCPQELNRYHQHIWIQHQCPEEESDSGEEKKFSRGTVADRASSCSICAQSVVISNVGVKYNHEPRAPTSKERILVGSN
jgi:hypothetical protein